ncbi:flagellar basal body-associated FliL family protein [Rhizobiaceae bacterium BDR2-2]|uniref:Flagellar protein FliL n=1 Tax=Ectorhizobium quercum TaxID=2965071 RepID=A0AAE3MVT3_9HYPH|nr:flagellar basal body-associated FliL family protein [Ectorhizobium quercum]MCX8996108.1 flagellar basal body-associated FliL family protein [Ectorhizobium quercum]
MADELAEGGEDASKKKSGLILTIAGVAVLTLVGAGGGWIVGNMLAPGISQAEAEQAAAAEHAAAPAGGHGAPGGEEEGGLPRVATEANGTVLLEPITTNLAYPAENWIRLEVALTFNGVPDAPLAETIHQDILAYLKTVSLQQIQGPRGFQYLREDLQERVDLRSQGRVSKVLFRTFVIE